MVVKHVSIGTTEIYFIDNIYELWIANLEISYALIPYPFDYIKHVTFGPTEILNYENNNNILNLEIDYYYNTFFTSP